MISSILAIDTCNKIHGMYLSEFINLVLTYIQVIGSIIIAGAIIILLVIHLKNKKDIKTIKNKLIILIILLLIMLNFKSLIMIIIHLFDIGIECAQ